MNTIFSASTRSSVTRLSTFHNRELPVVIYNARHVLFLPKRYHYQPPPTICMVSHMELGWSSPVAVSAVFVCNMSFLLLGRFMTFSLSLEYCSDSIILLLYSMNLWLRVKNSPFADLHFSLFSFVNANPP